MNAQLIKEAPLAFENIEAFSESLDKSTHKEAKKPKKEKAVATTAVHPLAAKIMENQAKPKKGK